MSMNKKGAVRIESWDATRLEDEEGPAKITEKEWSIMLGENQG